MRRIVTAVAIVAVAVGLIVSIAASIGAAPDDGKMIVKSIQCESLTVQSPGSKSRVDILARKDGTGIWVMSGNGIGSIGLIVSNGDTPYLAIYDDKGGLPKMALTADRFQFPKDDSVSDVTILSLKDVLAAARAAKTNSR
jgi:hypothetical protein